MRKNEKKNKFLPIQHLCIALILVPNGLDKINHHHNFIGLFILLLASIIIAYFIYQKRSKTKNNRFLITVYIVESLALFLTAYSYFIEGKRFLPYLIILAGIGYLIAAGVQIFKKKELINVGTVEN